MNSLATLLRIYQYFNNTKNEVMAANSLLNDYLKHDVLVERAKIPSNGCDDITFSLFAGER